MANISSINGNPIVVSGSNVTEKTLPASALTDDAFAQLANGKEIRFLMDELLATYQSDNLLNPNTSQRKDGVWAYSSSGEIYSNADWALLLLPVTGGSQMVCTYNNTHICFLEDFNDVTGVAVGDTLSGFISGMVQPANTAFDVPNNAMYMTVSMGKASLDSGNYGLYYGSRNLNRKYNAVIPEVADMERQMLDKLDAVLGKNLFNPNTENKLVGLFVNAPDGVVGANDKYSTFAIPINGGSTISINMARDYHAAFFSELSDISGLVAGNRVSGYISGFANESGVNRAVPEDAVMMTVSIISARAWAVQVEYGSSTSDYEPYVRGLPASSVIGLSDYSGTLIVGSGMQYTKIADAIAAAKDGDTILIMAGTYREAIDCRTKKIRLKGISRDAVTLIYSNIQYQEPPLEIAKGSVEDMTIIADGQNTSGGAYCVHIDFDESTGQSLQFKNVRFYNDALGNGRPCVGVGLRENFRLSFLNCEFESAVGETFYCHEQQASDKANQYVELIDCSIISHSESASEPTILLQETPALENTSATIRMQRCIVKNLAGGRVIGAQQWKGTHPGLTYDGYLGTKLWTLDPASALNSDDQLNA